MNVIHTTLLCSLHLAVVYFKESITEKLNENNSLHMVTTLLYMLSAVLVKSPSILLPFAKLSTRSSFSDSHKEADCISMLLLDL